MNLYRGLAHEFAHNLSIGDEYKPANPSYTNCTVTAGGPLFQIDPTTGGYYKNCAVSERYRSTENSIMNRIRVNPSGGKFNVLSCAWIVHGLAGQAMDAAVNYCRTYDVVNPF